MLQSVKQLQDLTVRSEFVYVCHSCCKSSFQPAQTFCSPQRTDGSFNNSINQRIPATRRSFHHISSHLRPTNQRRAAQIEHREDDFSIDLKASRAARSKFQPLPQHSPAESQIRDFLRAWSSQHEETIRRNTPHTIGADGRIFRLPNALFVGRQNDHTQKPMDVDQPGFEASHEDVDGSSQLIQPGTLLWYTGLGSTGQFAAYIGNIGIQSLLALENGNWAIDRLMSFRKVTSDSSRLRVPDFLTPAEVRPLEQHMPKASVSRPIAGSEATTEISMKGSMPPELIDSFMNKMRNFRQEIDDYVRHFADLYDDGYHRIADEHEYRSMSLRDFLRQGFDIDWERSSFARKMAIVQHLTEQDSVTTYQTAEELSVLIMSSSMHHNFQQVVEWARQYQDTASKAAIGKEVGVLLSSNPLTAFINKARGLIVMSRKSRPPSINGALGPSARQDDHATPELEKLPTGVDFTESEQLFIDFIWTMCHRLPLAAPNGPMKYLPVASLILRATGAYPGLVLDHVVARLFLKEIGCADPWTPRTRDLAMPLHGGKASRVADTLHKELQDFEKIFRDGCTSRNLNELDSMSDIRTDLFNLTAYAIDPTESQLPEDAVSIEPADEIEGAHWVHVHIAHITAFFKPDSIIGRFAKHQGSSFSSIDKSVRSAMVPRSIAEQFVTQPGSPVLTISTLVAADGTSMDVKISANRLQKVVKITTKAVEDVLRVHHRSDKDSTKMFLGRLAQHKETITTADELEIARQHKDVLQTLSSILQLRSQKRFQELPEHVSIPRYDFDVDIQVSHVEEMDSQRERKSYHWRGDPDIFVTAQHLVQRTTELRRIDDVVAQAMRLASESAARWLSDRNIPAVFMGTEPLPGNSFATIAEKQPHEPFLMPLFRRSSTPVRYWNYHLKAYCSCTSPLRRYTDMLALWQIDSYLKAEAANQIPLRQPVREEKLFNFTKDDVDDYLRMESHALETVDHTLRRIKETYLIQALFRAFHFDEVALPKQWEVLVTEPAKLSANLREKPATGFLVPFGCACEIHPSAEGWEKMAQLGQYLPVTIEVVDTERLLVHCRVNGPPSNVQKYTEPFCTSRDASTLSNS